MLEAPWNVGETVRLHTTVTVLNGNGMAPADPSTLSLQVKRPGTPVITYRFDELSHDDVGKFHVDIVLDLSGTWYFRWQSGGTLSSATEGSITVQPSRFK